MSLANHITFEHPFNCLVSAPSGAGKTVLVRRILANHKHLIRNNKTPLPDILRVVWIHGQSQPLHSVPVTNVNIDYLEEDEWCEDEVRARKPHLIIIDDCQESIKKDKRITNLIIRGSHHGNFGVFLLLQNLFTQGSEMRTISLNCHYFLLLRNARDTSQLTRLASQIFNKDKQRKTLIDAYNTATSVPFGHLLIDVKPYTDESLRIQSNLLKDPPQRSVIFYVT